ncbi:WhiB family transcriptional regulator [Nocardia tengchongensis]|uniref:WhiB family transcriptional regulator n=1 Tax=Nocardia tengchongensis TaxID=2055889 RepID=UPI00364DF9DC
MVIGTLETIDIDSLSWRDFGLCAQTAPDAFYPDKGESTEPAKQICQRCAVTRECLNYALDNEEQFGVWGGTSPRERRMMRRRTALTNAA